MSWLPSIFESTPASTAFERRAMPGFDDLFSMLAEQNTTGWTSTRVDLRETPNEYIMEADLPGFRKEEISVSLNDHVLTISAQQQQQKEEKNTDYILKERRSRSVQRSFTLSAAGEDVKAEFRDGVLKLHVKKTPDKQTKRITIQ